MIKFLAKYYKTIIHILVWILFLLFNLSYFSSFQGIIVALKRGIMILLIYLSVFYINWFYLIPRFYIKKKYFRFALAIFILLTATAFIRIEIEKYANIIPNMTRQPFIQNKFLRQFLLSFSMSGFVFIISLLFRLTEYYTLQTRQKDILLQQNTEAELKLLKAQINPHFLFNALNNIYALVLTCSENAAGSLMSLSQLLRYIIYETSAKTVTLEKEITYLNYYIELESLRIPDTYNLEYDIYPEPGSYKIMPLIFIPFVENSFKHSDINTGGYIKIRMFLEKNELTFICENSFSNTKKNVDATGGVGLSNSKKRLEILYPENHTLNISKKENVFKIELRLLL